MFAALSKPEVPLFQRVSLEFLESEQPSGQPLLELVAIITFRRGMTTTDVHSLLPAAKWQYLMDQ